MQQMSTCPSCGSPLRHGAKFCGSCGATLMPSPQPPMRNPIYPQQADYSQQPDYQPPPGGYMPPQQPGWNQQQAWGQQQPPPPGRQPGPGHYPQQPPQGAYGYRPATPPKKSLPGGLLLVLLAATLLILGGVAALISSLPSKTPTAVTPTTPPASTPKPAETPTAQPIVPLKMTAKEIIDAYKANGPAADAKYRSKIIQVTGTIASANLASDTPSVKLTPTGSDDERGIRCLLSSSSTGTLEVGKSVTIEGFIGNYNIDVLLMDSKIVNK